jgi:hypothetical protein
MLKAQLQLRHSTQEKCLNKNQNQNQNSNPK